MKANKLTASNFMLWDSLNKRELKAKGGKIHFLLYLIYFLNKSFLYKKLLKI